MVPELNADGGIILTASHNPKQWNAEIAQRKRRIYQWKDGAEMLEIAEKKISTLPKLTI